MPDSIGLDEAVRALNAGVRRELAAHPAADELFAYHAGELAAAEAEDLRDHLAICRVCARTVLDLATFPDLLPRDPEGVLSDPQLADEIAAVRARLVDRHPPVAEVVPFRPPRTPAFRQPAWLIAAMLALALVGLSFWVHALRGTVAGLREPELNVWTVSLVASERSGESGPEEVQFERRQGRLVLFFNYLDPADRQFGDYAIEILAMDGELVWGSSGLVPHPIAGNFSIGLTESFLPAGEYRFVLYGLEKEVRERLESYVVLLEYE